MPEARAARGEHDDFEVAEQVIHAGLAALARGDWDTVRSLAHDDGEHVTRDGVFLGPERLISEFGPQLERWTISFYLEELIDAGGGTLGFRGARGSRRAASALTSGASGERVAMTFPRLETKCFPG